MKRVAKLSVFIALTVLFLIPLSGNNTVAIDTTLNQNNNFRIYDGVTSVAGTQDLASWWNSSFIYRRYFNFTEPNIVDRTLTPVHPFLTFESGHCYRDSLRVLYYSNPNWISVPFTLWNTTYDASGNYILSTRISFKVNVSKGTTEMNYYIYYSKTSMGSVSYPDFYPFVYRSYTYSMLNLISYYDNNNYVVKMWDTSNNVWDDPRNIDTQWASATGIIQSGVVTNDPTGTLNRYQVVRIEPNVDTYINTAFLGFYQIESNYPLAVTAGSGHKNSNPAVNDWYPNVNELSDGLGTKFLIGGVSGFDSYYEGKYWIQAHSDNTEVWVWTVSESLDSGWVFYNNTAVTSWPAKLSAGEYISKRDVTYQTVYMVNSTKPVSVRSGDVDAAYSRDVMGPYPSLTGSLVDEEFYAIGMGNTGDRIRVTNVGSDSATISVYRNTGSGWTLETSQIIAADGYYDIAPGTASDTDPEDLLHIVGTSNAKLMVEGVYSPTSATDYGDWVPTTNGYRFGTDFKLWGFSQMKFFIYACENAQVSITGANSGTLDIPAGGADFFLPLSSSPSLYTISSNTTISVTRVARFYTSAPYAPYGDQGYGWMVPAYVPDQDEYGVSHIIGIEKHLFEFDITVVDLDGEPVQGASVSIHFTNGTLWVDEQGRTRTGTTDSSGMIVFEGLSNQTYQIRTGINAASWLTTSETYIWVNDTSNHAITSSVTPVQITLDMASIYIHLSDLDGVSMDDTPDEDVFMRLCTGVDFNQYVHQAQANGTGWLVFPRVPQNDYNLYAKYAGANGYNLFGYEVIRRYANWTISASEFSAGSIVHNNWEFPLTSLQIHVYSWDGKNVPNAHVEINNTANGVDYIYILTEVTNGSGYVTFNRIVNGTWNVNTWRYDDFGQKTWNNSQVLSNVQSFTSTEINLRLTSLIVRVMTGGNPVEGATVDLLIDNSTLLATGQTNASGHITFQWIRGNMTSPLNYRYSVNVTKGNSLNWTWVDADYSLTTNILILPEPQYSQTYTELSSTSGFEDAFWYNNFTFLIEYYNYTSTLATPEMKNISYDLSSILTVSIYTYDGTTLIGQFSWTLTTTTYIEQYPSPNQRKFNVTIDLAYWKLNASGNPYKVIITAHTDGYDDPNDFVIYLTVHNAQTAFGSDTALAFTEPYRMNEDHLFWLEDLSNADLGNITALDVYSYEIYSGGLLIRSGNLVNNTDGTFTLPSSALNGLTVGSYIVSINLDALNYEAAEQGFTLTIVEAPMKIANIVAPDYNWAPLLGTISFEYLLNNNNTSPDLAGVSLTVRWINPTTSEIVVTQELTISPFSSIYYYNFSRNIVPSGTWDVNITCSKSNYATATALYSGIVVSNAPTTLTVVGSNSITVDWGESAEFEVYYERVEDSAFLASASSSHNWTISSVLIRDLGNGHYTISVETDIESGTYALDLTLSYNNHESKSILLTVIVRVPLQIVSEYSSAENPLETYWTHNFTIDVIVYDISRTNVTVDGADLTYQWYMQYVVDQSGTLTNNGNGSYSVTLNAYDALPLSQLYTVTISATMAGSTSSSITIFVRINSVPNEIVLEQSFFEVYYADVFDVRFYWNNTLDNQPITSADSTTYYLASLGTYITTGVNEGEGWYHFTVDTRALEMNTDGAAVYVIQITHAKDGYAPHDITTVIILVRETDASLVVDPIDNVNWSDSFTITASLYDDRHGDLIWIGAQVTVSYGTYSAVMTNNLDGTFTVAIDSDAWFAASAIPYNLTFTYTIPNYVDSTNSSSVIIDPIPGVINKDPTTDDPIVVIWGDMVTVRVSVNNIYGGGNTPIDDTAVYYLWSGYDTLHPMTFLPSTHDYYVEFNSSEVPSGSYNLIVRVINENFTIPDLLISATVNPVSTTLIGDVNSIVAIVGVDQTARVVLTYSMVGGTPLSGATVYYDWAGLTRNGIPSDGNYVCDFNPSETTLDVPGVYVLTFHAELQNYTAQTYNVSLHLIAQTEIQVENQVLQSDQILRLHFKYYDLTNDREVPVSAIISLTLILPDGSTMPVNLDNHDTNGYFVDIAATAIGEESTDAYPLYIIALATGYQNHTQTEYPESFTVLIIEPQIEIPVLSNFIGPIPKSWLILAGGISFIFLIGIAGAVAIRRMRIPYQIKQINKALKAIENQKRAEVEGIKSMGQVIAELLAPGLAELNLPAPVIEVGPSEIYEEVLDEETEGLLDELDALEDIGEAEGAPEEPIDYEAELQAELEAVEVPEEPTEIKPEVEEAAEEPEVEEPTEEVEAEPEPEPEAEVEAEAEEKPEPEAKAEAELEGEEAPVEPAIEPEAEESEDTTTEEPDSLEEEPVSEDSEADSEEPTDESFEEDMAESTESTDIGESLSKEEIIERLPPEIKESMSVEELKALTKEELLALLKSPKQGGEE